MLLILGVVLVMAPGLIADLPDRDAGVFLYTGSQILQGKLPYLDVWDHKGPLIYYINALGVALSPGSELGVWLLEGMALLAAGGGLYWMMRRAFGGVAAALGALAFFGGIGFTLLPGNYTEEFALPLQVLALALFTTMANDDPLDHGRWLLIGVTAAAAFLLRPDNAGIQAAMAVYLLLSWRSREGTPVALGYFGVGAASLVVPVAAYFAVMDGLGPMLDALLRYNALYVSATLPARLDAVFEGLRILAPTGLMLLAIAGWVSSVFHASRAAPRSEKTRLLSLAAVALPVQMGMVLLAGRSLDHYYLNWLPIAAVLAAHSVSQFLTFSSKSSNAIWMRWPHRTSWAVGLTLALIALPARRLLPPFVGLLRNGPRQPAALVSDLADYPQKYLLMWGAESAYNFLTLKPSPTRFVYQNPLYACGYFTDEMVHQFQQDILQRRPLIVDSSSSNAAVPPLDSAQRADWAGTSDNCSLSHETLELLDYIEANYELVGRTRYAGWPIYQLAS